MDTNFVKKLKPQIQKYQSVHSPVNSSNSKANILLRNTFSFEAYEEYTNMRKKAADTKKDRK